MAHAPPKVTIKAVLEEFLADQKARISAKTLGQYRSVVSLFESFLEGYWPGHDGENADEKNYCDTYGPDEIPDAYSEFLGYFLPRKVVCGKETLRAAGTVTKKLAAWLVEKGYVEADDAAVAAQRAAEAARDLPASADVADMLSAYVEWDPIGETSEEVEDHFSVTRVEPGKVWLDPLTGCETLGPIPLPKSITSRLKEGWDIGGTLGKTRKGWRLIEVWNVSP